jgi:Zn-dependent oligopeptidase
MFVTKFASDLMDRVVGLRYREVVLKPGSSKEGMEIMREFLGREANAEAWYREIGMVV